MPSEGGPFVGIVLGTALLVGALTVRRAEEDPRPRRLPFPGGESLTALGSTLVAMTLLRAAARDRQSRAAIGD